jgi:taurine transport system permease protein
MNIAETTLNMAEKTFMSNQAADPAPIRFPGLAASVRHRLNLGRRPALGVWSVVAMAAGWWAIVASGAVSRDLLPSPIDVWDAALEVVTQGYRGTTLWGNALSTLGRLLGGFGAALIVGVPLGLWMGSNRVANAGIDWIIQFMRPLPPLSYMILLILWLGTGDLSKVALLFLTAFPIIVAASAAGVRGVKQQRIQVALALGASRADVFRHVILPSAAPMVMTGLQIALAAAFSTVVSAELLAATDGLGWMVISASTFLRNDIIILCILVLGLLGVALAAMLRGLDRWAIHWRGRD